MKISLPRKARFFWVYPLVGLMFFTAHISEWSFRLGAVLVLLGEAVRVWADGYVGHLKVNATDGKATTPKIGHLITGGPYAYVRHPLYVGSFLIGAGFCVATASVPMAIGGLVLFIVLYGRKAASEEALIRQEWGAEHEAYCRSVPRWWPTWRPYAHPYGQWTWQGIRASKELKTVVWVLVALIGMYLYEALVGKREPFLGQAWLKHVMLIAALAILIITEGVSELAHRWRPRLPQSS